MSARMEAALAELKAAIEEEGSAPCGELVGIIRDVHDTRAFGWIGPEDVIEVVQYRNGLDWDCPEDVDWAMEQAKEIAEDIAHEFQVDWSEINWSIAARFDEALREKTMATTEAA